MTTELAAGEQVWKKRTLQDAIHNLGGLYAGPRNLSNLL